MKNITYEEKRRLPIGNLEYGTVVTGVPSNPDCFYIKIKKSSRKGFSLNVNPQHSMLVNLKCGTLRAIPGSTLVTVLDSQLSLSTANDPGQYKKSVETLYEEEE